MIVECLRTSGSLKGVHLKLTTSVAGEINVSLWIRVFYESVP